MIFVRLRLTARFGLPCEIAGPGPASRTRWFALSSLMIFVRLRLTARFGFAFACGALRKGLGGSRFRP